MVVAGKLLVALAAVGLLFAAVAWPALQQMNARRFDRLALAWALLSRLGLFLLVFVALGQHPQSDMTIIHDGAQHVLRGQTPYNDFFMPYAPLHGYLTAAPLLLWHNPQAIVLQAIIIELLSIGVWLRVLRRFLSEPQARLAAILYLTSPLPLLHTALSGQNQSWVSLGLGLSLWAWASHRQVLSGLGQGLCMVAVKFLVLLYVPVLLVYTRAWGRWLAAFAGLTLLVYGGFALAGVDVLDPVRSMGAERSSGNLPYLASVLGVPFDSSPRTRSALNVLGMVGLMAVFLAALRRGAIRRPGRIIALVSLVTFALALLSKKSLPNYLVMGFFPICMVYATQRLNGRLLLLFGLLGVVASVEPSIYYRYMSARDLRTLWGGGAPGGPAPTIVLGFLALQCVLLGLYLQHALLAWRTTTAGHPDLDWPQLPPGEPLPQPAALACLFATDARGADAGCPSRS